MQKHLQEALIILVALAVVIGAAYGLTRSWLAVGLIFLSGLGLGAVWLVVRAIRMVTGRHRS